jgi:hypothetical protein
VVSSTPRPYVTPGKDPGPIVQEAGWATGPVRTGAENLAPTGIRSPDRPARSQSLHLLRVVDELITFLPLVCSVYVITGLSLNLCRISDLHFVRFDSIVTIQTTN